MPRITKEELKSEMDKETTFILARLKESKELVGCTAVGKPELSNDDIPSSYLSLQAVKTEYRKRGLNQFLLDESIKIAKKMGAKKVHLIILGDLIFFVNYILKQGFKLMDITTKHKSELPFHHSKHIRESISLCSMEKNI